MRVFILELFGMASFIVAGWLVSPALGMAVIGVATFVSAWSLARITKDEDK